MHALVASKKFKMERIPFIIGMVCNRWYVTDKQNFRFGSSGNKPLKIPSGNKIVIPVPKIMVLYLFVIAKEMCQPAVIDVRTFVIKGTKTPTLPI